MYSIVGGLNSLMSFSHFFQGEMSVFYELTGKTIQSKPRISTVSPNHGSQPQLDKENCTILFLQGMRKYVLNANLIYELTLR